MLDKLDKKILTEISKDLSISKDFFGEIASKLGISKGEVIERLKRMQYAGILKRIAPVVKHYNTGYVFNAMIVWAVDDETDKSKISMLMKAYENISHVYEREKGPNWPYNMYTMIHGRSCEEIKSVVAALSKCIDSEVYKVLFTKRQWKKASPDMEYLFSDE
ncbi:AsnC family transcriptional regulator [Geosporobacter ferrireducens]|uniref:siroheme decarboxylase n=1 Tax=Geosporobacter ferrireducens TaxID=1424294 RepID=A0A1D8GE34_9FIRM|nr:AsnC family transcriptional regulator [Geosporobacter ferrireducens]AOT69165.1 hypothetical protein Gferi_06065 [Geosporobacter ferrireducens]MTI56842.1 Lrp/AsnC family transcriptional regulator [Geosporobacter ferrireducens]